MNFLFFLLYYVHDRVLLFFSLQMKAPRRQCCSISSFSSNMLVVGIKQCGSDELISMQN